MGWFKSLVKREGVGETSWEKQHHGIFYGDTTDGRPHGEGRFVCSSGLCVKVGTWSFGEFHGHGRHEIWYTPHPTKEGRDQYDPPNPSYSEGNFVYGVLEGNGTDVGPLGKYEGNFVNGIENGQGKLVRYNGLVYEGEFLRGKAHGKGAIFNKDGKLLYSGKWNMNCPVEKLNTPFTSPDQGIWSENISKFLLPDDY